MKVFTKESVVAGIPSAWRSQYRENSGDKYEIYKRLKAEKNLTEDKAEEIIGNRSWSRIDCDECQKDSQIVVQLGQEPNYESRTALICVDCLENAMKLVKFQSKV